MWCTDANYCSCYIGNIHAKEICRYGAADNDGNKGFGCFCYGVFVTAIDNKRSAALLGELQLVFSNIN